MSHVRRTPPSKYRASIRKRRQKRRIIGIIFTIIIVGSIVGIVIAFL
ncbi:MAG: hypothetical protein ACFFAU_17505 [Candidatus Hodarchaeota archaeon]